MKPEIIEAGWMPLSDACREIGMSPRTMETWVRHKVINSKLVQREGRPPERLFEAADVARLAKVKQAKRLTATAQKDKPATQIAKAPSPGQEVVDTVAIIDKVFSTLRAERQSDREDARLEREAELRRAEERARPWLTLQQAIEVSGLTAAAIRRAVKEEKLVAMKAGGLRIKRASLESL